MVFDLHKSDEMLRKEVERIKKSEIPEENKQILLNFAKELQIEGIKPSRTVRYLMTLRVIQRWRNKPFKEWNEEDIKDVLFEIENNGYKVQTIKEFRKGMRRFFKWLNGEEWKPLKVLKGDRKDKRKPDVLSEEEISRMIECAVNNRDKAIIAVGYEAGLRIGELASLTWNHVTWTEWGARLKVHGKTGERVIPIVMSASYLRQWMIEHPAYDVRNNEIPPAKLVFTRINGSKAGEPMSYQMFAKVIKKSAERARIRKRVYPHILRHSRATILANTLTEQQMNLYFGWVQGSNMPAVYVHLSGRDIEGAIKKVYGLESEEEDKRLQPQKCPRCGELNTPTARFCHKCGLVLDEKERLQAQLDEAKVMPELMTRILEKPELREKFKAVLTLAESFENNPRAMEMLSKLVDEVTSKV